MEKLNTEDGQLFIKSLARFVRTHEKALANAMQMRRQSRSVDLSSSQSNSAVHNNNINNNSNNNHNGHNNHNHLLLQQHGASGRTSTASALAAALSLGTLGFASDSVRPARLTLTPHHLFYLLSRFEELSVPVGPLNIRLENINNETSSAYVSFLSKPQRPRGGAGGSGGGIETRYIPFPASAALGAFTSRDSVSKSDKAKAALEADLKYLYSSFTKIPCLRLAPDHRARLISGYEEFPFDTAVPLHSFKNLSALEIIDVDFRSFFGWDRLAEQLRSLTLKRAQLEDIGDLLTGIVLDDIDKRRRRSSKSQPSPVLGWPSSSSHHSHSHSHSHFSSTAPELGKSLSAPGSPLGDTVFGTSASPPKESSAAMLRGDSSEGAAGGSRKKHGRAGSISPGRPSSSSNKPGSSHRHHHHHGHHRGQSSKMKRSGSGSSDSGESFSTFFHRDRGISNMMASTSTAASAGNNNCNNTCLSPFKWRFLRHLNLTDNSLTSVTVASLAPVANTLHSLDLSWNLFTEVPDSLASLVALRSLNLSHCMIDSLHSLSRSPLPAITSLNLRGNRLRSIAGVERLLSLERLDLRDNAITDPVELARLTAIPYIREIWISGNPFTKSHPGHRVTIFNLFRQTPGYPEDIFIDNTGPSYSERKQLVERVAEPEAAPVIRKFEQQADSQAEGVPITVSSAAGAAGAGTGATAVDQELLSPETHVVKPRGSSVAAADVTSPRRKKHHRKRVVGLSTNDTSSTTTNTTTTTSSSSSTVHAAVPVSTMPALAPALAPAPAPVQLESKFPEGSMVRSQPVPDPFVDLPTPKPNPREMLLQQEQEPLVSPTTVASVHTARTPTPASDDSPKPGTATSISTTTTATEVETPKGRTAFTGLDNIDWDVSGDIYRQRLEALKHEVGTNWLTVLGDDNLGWANNTKNINLHTQAPDFHHAAAAPIRPPPPIARTSSQIIVTGGRALG
ncbi:leucine Rich Repeat domain-containing protein [Nannizzia gypsea CBS 118893]|uniref:Leucine Rich Repeat domain-containing protein n=1 Tax=Arthroderma gypseum (strain ATCC MYA-4604 / CBS 118893) TaxID=535722 RepID=E4V319_ARTGP|nr:leucine Rich Repeat domain-containing protein [Nannizzia gypsea CBS 118893]EFR04393.1 leucine Rich Repeat domain-containing protein [Nannizzia gypsea CBS 118893]